MTNEEKYKLALFGIIRNSQVMPELLIQGYDMEYINTVSVMTMNNILKAWDYDNLRKSFEEGSKKS